MYVDHLLTTFSPFPSLTLTHTTAVMERLYKYVHPITKKHSPMISEATYDIITKNADVCLLFIDDYFIVHICFFFSPASQFSHHLRQGFQLHLLWIQDTGTLLPNQN